MHVDEGKLASVIDRFYEAAAQPELWRTVLQEYAEALGGVAAIILTAPEAKMEPIHSEVFDEAVEAGARQGWFPLNPRIARGQRVVRGSLDILTEERLFTPEEIKKSPWYVDFLHKHGFGWFIGMYLVPAGQASLMLSVERGTKRGPFLQREVDVLAKAAPHIQRAGQIAARVSAARAGGLLEAFDLLDCGGVLIDLTGRIIRTNEQADRQFGKGLFVSHGHMIASDPQANARLQRLIGSVLPCRPTCDTPIGGAVVIPRMGESPLVVHAAPLTGSTRDLFQRTTAVLMIVDPGQHPQPSVALLRQAFGLSPAEARLAAEIGTGRDLKEIAISHGVSEGTVRAQLKAIFTKTDTHRQADLVSLINRMSMPMLKR